MNENLGVLAAHNDAIASSTSSRPLRRGHSSSPSSPSRMTPPGGNSSHSSRVLAFMRNPSLVAGGRQLSQQVIDQARRESFRVQLYAKIAQLRDLQPLVAAGVDSREGRKVHVHVEAESVVTAAAPYP